MKTVRKFLQTASVSIAILFIALSLEVPEVKGSGATSYSQSVAALALLALVVLDWSLLRYISEDCLSVGLERVSLNLLAKTRYVYIVSQWTTSLGYSVAFVYVIEVAGYLRLVDHATLAKHLFISTSLLFVGVIARARSVLEALAKTR